MIPPAIDVSQFRPGDSASARGRLGLTRFTIGFVGRFVPEKGIDILLQASAALRFDHEILLVGSGPDERRFWKLSKELGVAERVHWAGPASHELLPELYNAMDILVLPSRTTPLWKEQFGRVLIEAMACGVPVVGSGSGETPATIGGEGLVFADGDVEGLAAQIVKLHDYPELRKGMGEGGRKRVSERFSTANVAAMYIPFFERVCSSKPIA
jgi:glycosyltransferase involved in cell wall biosynthesis